MIYVNGQPTAEFVPEIADNLTTDDATKALSAKQGKVLNEKLVEYGQTTPVTINANSYQDITINFSKPHGSNPIVIPTLKSTGSNPDNVTAWNNINCIVLPVTSSTSATIRIFNANTAITVSAYLSYIVVG